MRIRILTSSRADYGIYRPLLERLSADPRFEPGLIVFGTHMSPFHGMTVEAIREDGFPIIRTVETVLAADSPGAVSTSMGLTLGRFASVWETEAAHCDLAIVLGDRYEMFAAAAAAVPFQVRIAHIHGGETTLGAIDNVFRHSLTLMARYHFVSTEEYGRRVREIVGGPGGVHVVGALGLDNIRKLEHLDVGAFRERFGIDLSRPTVLVTFHPETVDFGANVHYAHELVGALGDLARYQIVVTLPNADTAASHIRQALLAFAQGKADVHCVESLGTVGYLSCMKHAAFLLGNSSSGIIEAASFGKYVIDLGERQRGRAAGPNVLRCPVERDLIAACVDRIEKSPALSTDNIYGDGHAAGRIMGVLESLLHPHEPQSAPVRMPGAGAGARP